MNVQQAAAVLGVDPRTVRRMIVSGDLSATKNGDGRTSSYVLDEDQVRAKADERANA